MKTFSTLLLASLLAGVAFSRLMAAPVMLAYGQAELGGSLDIFSDTNAGKIPAFGYWSENLNTFGADTLYCGPNYGAGTWGQNFNLCSNVTAVSGHDTDVSPVPEPAMIALSGVAAVLIMSGRRRRQKNRLPNDN